MNIHISGSQRYRHYRIKKDVLVDNRESRRMYTIVKSEEWGVTIKTKDVLYQELSSERTRAKQILGAVMRSWSISDPCDEIKKGLWRDPGEVVDLTDL